MSDREVILLGGGGHGSVVLEALLRSGAKVMCVIDPKFKSGATLFGVPIRHDDADLKTAGPGRVLLANGLGLKPRLDTRIALYRTWCAQGYEFASAVHPSALIGREVRLGAGCQIMAGVILQCRVSVAENAVINTRASIDHDCRIAAHAFISPGVVLCGNVCVGEGALVGAGAIVLPGVQIGRNAVIGAGAVVNKTAPDGDVVVGTPARKKVP
jgi:UDP-perosamine 4-acetyltransferase